MGLGDDTGRAIETTSQGWGGVLDGEGGCLGFSPVWWISHTDSPVYSVEPQAEPRIG